MNNTNTTFADMCVPTAMGNFVVLITLIILPFHILMVKVLLFDLHLALPRHKIVFCLSISDALQIFITFSCATVMKIFSWTIESKECHAVRMVLYFTLAMTLVVSSLSVIALSVERYVACIHSFHLHEIITNKRVMYAISCIWIIGGFCGTVSVALAAQHWNNTPLAANLFMKVLPVVFVIPTSILVSGIQFQLLVFSRKKLARERSGKLFGSEAEMADVRKRQIKVAFVASIVVIVYIICMFPLSCLSLYGLINGDTSSKTARGIVQALTFFNNLANPYIYGIGVVDSRRALLKNLGKIKKLFTKQ